MRKNVTRFTALEASQKPVGHIKKKFRRAKRKSKKQMRQAEDDNGDLISFVQKYPYMLSKYPWMINRYPHLFANNASKNFYTKTIH